MAGVPCGLVTSNTQCALRCRLAELRVRQGSVNYICNRIFIQKGVQCTEIAFPAFRCSSLVPTSDFPRTSHEDTSVTSSHHRVLVTSPRSSKLSASPWSTSPVTAPRATLCRGSQLCLCAGHFAIAPRPSWLRLRILLGASLIVPAHYTRYAAELRQLRGYRSSPD